VFKAEARIEKKKRRLKKCKKGLARGESESMPMKTQAEQYARSNSNKLSVDGNSVESVKSNEFISILPDGFWAAQLTTHLIKATSDSVLNLQ
jgi:hypothetical protein